MPTPSPTSLTLHERHAIYETLDAEEIQKKFFTTDSMKKFSDKFGCLLDEIDLVRVGPKIAILTPIVDMARKLAVAGSICYFTNSPIFVLYVFNFSSLFYLMF